MKHDILMRGIIAFASLLCFASCQDEDFGYTLDDVRKGKYSREFTNAFGQIDPDQDWSMATQVTANVANAPADGILEIYSKDPMGSDAVLLAKAEVVDGSASVSFDVVKSATEIYARIKKSDCYYPVKGTFKISDGVVTIGSLKTRAAFEPKTGASNSALGEPFSYSSNMINWEKSSEFSWSAGSESNFAHWIDGYYVTSSGQPLQWNGSYYSWQSIDNFYPLTNVIKNSEGRPEWNAADLAHYFYKVGDEEPVFAEGVDHISYMKPNSDPQFVKDVIYTMAAKGPVTFDYFHKGTEFNNKFGYFYFTGDRPTVEQFKTMNKYILVDNMTTSTEGGWDLIQHNCYNENNWINKSNDNGMYASATTAKVRGTRLQLTYFGEEGPSYDFPKGTKIAFFMIGIGQERDKVLTSIASLNADLYNDCPRAATFKYKNEIIFAMEDQKDGGDGDVNDIMFIANGEFEETEEIPDIVPPTETESQSWTIACEDLGGTFDYDFNDLVFAVRKSQKESDETRAKLELLPLAAGGTMEAHIIYDGVDKGEIHSLLGSSSYSSPLRAEAGHSYGPGTPVTLESGISWSADITSLIKGKIKVRINQEDSGYYIDANKSSANAVPQMIILPSGWDWPSEGTRITEIYEGFADWAADGSVTDWCNTKKSGATNYVTNKMPSSVVSNSKTGGSTNDGGSTNGGGSTNDGGSSNGGGTTVYEGAALSAISTGNGTFVIPSSVFSMTKSLVIEITGRGEKHWGDNYDIIVHAKSTNMSGAGVKEFNEIADQYQTCNIPNAVENTTYSLHALSSAFDRIKQNGLTLQFEYGTISKIRVIQD